MSDAGRTEPDPPLDESEVGKLIPAPPGPDDGSFVARLERHFGAEVDPEITLQDDDESALEELTESDGDSDGGDSEAQDSDGSTATEGLLTKLSEKESASSRFRIKGEIARGGMGAILRVWDDDLRRNLAMKVLLSRGGADDLSKAPGDVNQELLSRFLEEAQITGQLDHPGIVPVHDLGIDESGRVYFTMRLVRGRDLKAILDLVENEREGWTLTKALNVVLKVCEAMAFAHSKGVVHRDLKPANIMVGRFGETYVMDWGLARVLGRRDSHDMRLKPTDASALSLVRTARKADQTGDPKSPLVTMDGDVIGTPSYMAPEQAAGRLEDVGPRSDVYAVGAILYQILAGHAPYVKPGAKVAPHTVLLAVLERSPMAIEDVNAEVPLELAAICEKAMQREPEERYPTMLAMAADIEAFLEGRVVGAYEAGPIAEARKWFQRNRGLAWAISIALLLAVGGLAGVIAVQVKANRGLAVAKQVAEDKEKEAATAAALANDAAAELSIQKEAAEANALAAERSADAAEEARDRARAQSYVASVRSAEYSLRLRQVVEALGLLDGCDEELRDWEWGYLGLLSQSQLGPPQYGVPVASLVVRGRRALLLGDFGTLDMFDVTGAGESQRRGSPDNLWALSTPDYVDFDLDPSGEVAGVIGRKPGRVALLSSAGFDLEVPPPARDLFQPYEVAEGDNGWLPPPDLEVPEVSGAEPVRVAFGATDDLLAVGYDNGALLVWDHAARDLLLALPGDGPERAVRALAWDPAGEHVAVADESGVVRIIDPWEGTAVFDGRTHEGPALALAYSPDGRRLATGGEDGRVRLWRIESGESIARHAGHTGPVRALAYHPDGRMLVSAGDDTTLQVWDLTGGAAAAGLGEDASDELLTLFGHEGSVGSLAYVEDGTLLCSAGRDGSLRVWDPRFAGPITELVDERYTRTAAAVRLKSVTAVDFHPDGYLALTGHADGSVAVWDSWTGELIDLYREHEHVVNSAVWSPDGRSILSASIDKRAILWDVASSSVTHKLQHAGFVNAAVFSPDGRFLVTGCADAAAYVYDVETGQRRLALEEHGGWVNAVALSPAGDRIWTGSRLRRESDPTLRAWSVESGELLSAFPLQADVLKLAVSDDGSLLAIGLSDGRLVVLANGDTEAFSREVTQSGDPITSLAFNRSGTRLVVGSVDGILRIFDARTGEDVLSLPGHSGGVTGAVFSDDDTRLLSGSAILGSREEFVQPGEVVARVWETSEGAERRLARRTAAELRRVAQPRVDYLFQRYFLRERVLGAISQDRLLTAEVREAAIRLARLRHDDGEALAEESWRVVRAGESTQEELEDALRRAEAAAGLLPDSELCTAVLGATQAANGIFPAALRSLEALERRPVRAARIGAMRDACAAWAHEALGHGEEARESFDAFLLNPVAGDEEFAGLRTMLVELLGDAQAPSTEG